MPGRLLDFRSDTVTRPTPPMRRAMAEAEVGDDVFGDDPTVNRLQEKVADLLGKEAALFVPSGTMGNQVSIAAHTEPGDEIYCEAGCHALNYEGGAPAHLSGVVMSPITGVRGRFTADDVEARLRPGDHHFAVSRLIWVENTHNRSGGSIFPQSQVLSLRALADRTGLKMHLDGARIWNAATATGMTERELAMPFDSVSCCLSKGLGCPVGSLVVGSRDFIDRAHRFRKRFGGGMRQAGILAAAGLYALDHHRERLAQDHLRARRLAEAVVELKSFAIDLEGVETNIVIFDAALMGLRGADVAGMLKADGLLVTAFGSRVRMVTHHDVNDDDVASAIAILRRLFK